MARPLPDPKETKRRAAEVDKLVAALGGRNAAVRAAETAGVTISPDTLKKISEGQRFARDELIEALKTTADDFPRWLVAKNGRQKWLIHNHNPAFTGRIVDGDLADIRWHGGKPSGRRHGDLLTQAREYLAQ